jgi:hypothetical protein
MKYIANPPHPLYDAHMLAYPQKNAHMTCCCMCCTRLSSGAGRLSI